MIDPVNKLDLENIELDQDLEDFIDSLLEDKKEKDEEESVLDEFSELLCDLICGE